MSRWLITIGIMIVVVGLLWPWITKLELGQLPGDIAVKKENFRFYFPFSTSIIISIILSLAFWFFRK